jgi:integrase
VSRVRPGQLTARKVVSLKNGMHGDGGGLWLNVEGKSSSWSFRYKSPVTGKRRQMGLGSFPDVSLARARDEAAAARQLMSQGIDPLERRQEMRVPKSIATPHTFREVAERFIGDQSAGWTSAKVATNWIGSLRLHALPRIGSKAVDAIVLEDVLGVIRPIWTTKTETAERVRNRIERILDYAITHGWRKGENPARWKGHLSNVLPSRSSVAPVAHRGAVPWQEIAEVMDKLRKSSGIGALAVRFACLTAGRSNEIRGAAWAEIDIAARLWVVPASRMKMNRDHRVPLSAQAMTLLLGLHPMSSGGALVFPGGRPGRPLSDVALSKALHLAAGTKDVTVHGLRSTFRDWAAETTDYPRDVAEMALAHAIGDKVEAAYRRGDLLEKRREMMEAWGQWCTSLTKDVGLL